MSNFEKILETIGGLFFFACLFFFGWVANVVLQEAHAWPNRAGIGLVENEAGAKRAGSHDYKHTGSV